MNTIILNGRVVRAGKAEGEALVSPDPIGFLGGVDPQTGVILDQFYKNPDLPAPAARTALEDLTDRALLTAGDEDRTFFLPPLTAQFLKRRHPEAVARSGKRLADRAYALAMENGWQNYERFPTLEAEWPRLAAALPRLLAGDNAPLQRVCPWCCQ